MNEGYLIISGPQAGQTYCSDFDTLQTAYTEEGPTFSRVPYEFPVTHYAWYRKVQVLCGAKVYHFWVHEDDDLDHSASEVLDLLIALASKDS